MKRVSFCLPLSQSRVFREEQLNELIWYSLDLQRHLDLFVEGSWREIDLKRWGVADCDLAAVLTHHSHFLLHP